MITSALISELRREYDDNPKTVRVARRGNGSINIFNTGKFPVIENSYIVKVNNNTLTSAHATSGYTLDLDNGDLQVNATPANGQEVTVDMKYADWRDKNWLEAINGAISHLNGRGFFKQTVREAKYLSANVNSVSGPTNAVDMYELLYKPNSTGNPIKLGINWSYQQDANKIILGTRLSIPLSGFVSYLRNILTYTATSATLDVPDSWIELVKKRAGATFYRSMAGKIARQGSATIKDGHLSFTNLRTMANDLDNEFEKMAIRKKPTRPAKDIQFVINGGGVA
jgi:hypothetical protein